MSDNFEERMGELAGALKYFLPALEKLEAKLDVIRTELTETRTHVEHLREEIKNLKKRCTQHWDEIYKKLEEKMGKEDTAIMTIQTSQEKLSNRRWEVVKIVITAFLSASIPVIVYALTVGGSP